MLEAVQRCSRIQDSNMGWLVGCISLYVVVYICSNLMNFFKLYSIEVLYKIIKKMMYVLLAYGMFLSHTSHLSGNYLLILFT